MINDEIQTTHSLKYMLPIYCLDWSLEKKQSGWTYTLLLTDLERETASWKFSLKHKDPGETSLQMMSQSLSFWEAPWDISEDENDIPTPDEDKTPSPSSLE